MIAPAEAVGHFEWYIDVGNANGEVVGRIISPAGYDNTADRDRREQAEVRLEVSHNLL